MKQLLEIKNLNVAFSKDGTMTNVVSNLSLNIRENSCMGIVGESGSGKSVTSLATMRLLSSNAAKVTGEILFQGQDLLKLSENEMCDIRGNHIAMIFQEPMTSLNPIHTCGHQIAESVLLHSKATKNEANAKALELLKQCGIPSPEQRMKEYPHQMSGGMRQRIMIAIALACDPTLLVADEPTTALDVTIQAQILELMKGLQKDRNMSVMMITHDLGVIYDFCDRVAVVYMGEVVEIADVKDLFANPLHPYAEGLIGALPQLDKKQDRLTSIEGMVPDYKDMPTGCRFNPRCCYVMDICKEQKPELIDLDNERQVRCFRVNAGKNEYLTN